MLATIMPFVCMGVGLLVGFQSLPEKFYKVVDWVTTISLMLLMVTIGGNVGTSEDVIANLDTVGLNCLITCLCAIAGSVGLCFLVEKTILPLEKYSEMQIDDKSENAVHSDTDKKKIDPILILIPVCVIGGALGCYLFMPQEKVFLLDYSLWSSLVVLYTSVGIGMGQNKAVFGYMKKVGFKVIYLVLGVYLGSILGGAVSAWITGMPLNYALISASGAGYYSMTGATMLSVFGAEAGVYGFMVNVFRDFFYDFTVADFCSDKQKRTCCVRRRRQYGYHAGSDHKSCRTRAGAYRFDCGCGDYLWRAGDAADSLQYLCLISSVKLKRIKETVA